MNKSAQAGIVHVGLVVGLIILGVAVYYISQNPPDIFNGAKAAANREGSFSNLSADLKESSASFSFSYSGSAPKGYTIDVATSVDMKQNLYRRFGEGPASPIVVSNPQKYAQYKCSTILYWRVNVGKTSIRSSVSPAGVNCLTPTPTPTPTFSPEPSPTGIGTTSPSSPTPTPTPTATPSATISPTSSCTPQTKPATVTLQGADGTWCYDSDYPPPGEGGLYSAKISGYCIDSCSSRNDYCEDVTAPGTVRDGYCSGTWNGSSWNNVHCEFGGYVCPSLGLICSDGACR